MATIKSKDTNNLQQVKAIDRLLEVAEKKMIHEENWHSVDQYDDSKKRSSPHLLNRQKILDRRHMIINNKVQLQQKNHEKEKLKQLVRQHIDNEQEIHFYLQKTESQQYKNKLVSMDFLKNAKLRPFNSNMTFYSVKKEEKERIFNSSLNFYHNSLKMKYNSQDGIVPNRYPEIKSHNIKYNDFYLSSTSFSSSKPNKSETIRKLLNQMQIEKQKDSNISFKKDYKIRYESQEDIDLQQLNHFEIKEMNKYKKFIPFKDNEKLLLKKVIQNQNIWMKKFKESWKRRKSDIETKRNHFKKLILKD